MKEREQAISAAEQYVHALRCYEPHDILTGDYLISEYNPDLIMSLLSKLTPDNLRVTILTKNAKYLETKVSLPICKPLHNANLAKGYSDLDTKFNITFH